MKSPSILTALAIAATLILGTIARAEPTSYFRWDGGVAAADAHRLPDRFDSPDQLLWRQQILPGHSTPCVHGETIFLTTFDEQEKELATVAMDRATGELRWKRVAPVTRIEPCHQIGSPATCTPACDGERLYVFFGSYGLLCYDLEGKLLWSKPMGPFQDEFGAGSSPILVDGKVILNQDHDLDNFLVAIDQRSGETVWKTARNQFTRSYSTPIVWRQGDTTQIIVAGSLQLTAYDVKDGSPQWWVRGLSRIVDTTPVQADGLLYVATWTPGGDQTDRISMPPFAAALNQYDKNGDGKIAKAELSEGAVLTRFFRIDLDQNEQLDEAEWNKHMQVFEAAENVAMAIEPGGSGDVTDTHVKWIFRRGLPVVPSPLVYRGVVYMVKDGGIVSSLDAKTGQVLKQGRSRGRGNYYASPVAGDGKVYLASERGVVTVLKAAGKWEILSSHDFGERIMATPVMVKDKIFLRTESALYCFGKNPGKDSA